MNPNDEITINTTLKVKACDVVNLEDWLNYKYDLISFEHIANTDEMYKNDPVFKKLVKQAKDLKNARLDYIMKNNYKYK